MLKAKKLRSILHYSPENGAFRYKISPHGKFKAGTIAGYLHRQSNRNTDYWRIKIEAKQYLAHRLAWLYVHGEWPRTQIDHINGNGLDNRISNLREVSQSQNRANTPVQRDNKLGEKGIHFRRGKYIVQFFKNGKYAYQEKFNTLADARAARDAVYAKIHGEFARRAA